MRCKKCGGTLPDGAVFCAECGAPAEYGFNAASERICPNCHTQLMPDDMFCPNCGKTAQPINSAGKKKNGMETSTIIIIAALAVVLIILSVIVGYVLYSGDDPKPAPTPTPTAAVTVTPTPTPAPTASNVEPPPEPTMQQSSRGYLFDSDKAYITAPILDNLSQEQVRLILNEIYARHGYKFSLSKYSDYFSRQSWYIPRYENMQQVEEFFNNYEKYNKKFISNYETEKGWR